MLCRGGSTLCGNTQQRCRGGELGQRAHERRRVGMAAEHVPQRRVEAHDRAADGGAFQDEVRFGVSPGAYLLRFELQGAKGQVRYDWVTTKFAP